MNKRLVSGIQPSGSLHLGNYLGAIKQWVELQSDYDSIYFVADYHALSAKTDPVEYQQQVLETLAMIIALGVDPKNAKLFIQSQIPEHAELSWLLSSYVSIGQLNRMTQYKEKSNRQGQNAALLTYPILMAADVLIYDAEVVPVGDDQVQHLELTREIARAVNNHLGQVFVEPKPLLGHSSRIMSLQDPQIKMSKSVAGSAIGLLDDEATVIRTIKRAVTDSDPNSPKISPAIKNLFDILSGVSDQATVSKFEKLRVNGSLRYSELKEALVEELLAFLRPVQKTFHALIKEESNLLKIVELGTEQVRPIAIAKLREVKKALGLL